MLTQIASLEYSVLYSNPNKITMHPHSFQAAANALELQPHEFVWGGHLPLIPIATEIPQGPPAEKHPYSNFQIYNNTEKIIPGYNFQSLFRKKSHIGLARKRNKEQSQKRNSVKRYPQEQSANSAMNLQKGHWNNEQNKLYHWFLELHSRHFVLKYLRRTDKIFKSMASFIGTREAEQCRSHHQKMEKKYRNFYQILLKLRMDFYGTDSCERVKGELEDNGFEVGQQTLISEIELRNGEALPREGGEEESEQRYDIKQEEDSPNNANLMCENYESELPFTMQI